MDLKDVLWRVIGKRYVRLDRTVPGYGRLSPSVKREFLTYTVLGRNDQEETLGVRARAREDEIRRVSREKRLLARVRLHGVVDRLAGTGPDEDDVCFILAGDVVYGMAHAVERPESSTGKMVRGSDLDVVVVVRDATPAECVAALDRAILREKFQLLTHPTYREEIDYIIKPVSRMEEQLRFDTFEHRVASKILNEGDYLLGSRGLFDELKKMLRQAAVPEKLAELEVLARAYRQEAETRLYCGEGDPPREILHRFFYTREEEPEIY